MGFSDFLVVHSTIRGFFHTLQWLLLLTTIGLFVYVGTPLSRDQANILQGVRVGLTVVEGTTNFIITDIVNRFYSCLRPMRVVQQNSALFIKAVIQEIADEFGYDLFGRNCVQVRGLKREAPRATIISSTFCGFMSASLGFVQAFIDLIVAPFMTLLGIIIRGPGDLISILEGVIELIQDVLNDVLNEIGCSGSLPYSLFTCIGDRFASVVEVPLNTVRAFLAILLETFDPNGGTIIDAIDKLVGADVLFNTFRVVQDNISYAWETLTSGVMRVIDIFSNIAQISDFFGWLDGEINSLREDIEDFFEDLFDVFRTEYVIGPRPAQRELREIHERALISRNATRDLLEALITEIPPDTSLLPDEHPSTNRIIRAVQRFPKQALQNISEERAAQIRNKRHRDAWRMATRVFWDVIRSDGNLTVEHIHERFRSDGIRGRDLALMDDARGCPNVDNRVFDIRSIDVPPVTLDGNGIITIAGAVLLIASVLVIAIAFPGGAVVLVLVTFVSSIILFCVLGLTGFIGVYSAFRTGDYNASPYVQLGLFVFQHTGRTYFNKGFLSIDPIETIQETAPYVERAVWYTVLVGIDNVLCKLPLLNLCPPTTRPGDTIADKFAAMLQCRDNDPCDTTEDCCGQAVSCSNGRCICYGSVDIDMQVPTLRLQEQVNVDCTKFGYPTNDLELGFTWSYIKTSLIVTGYALRDAFRLCFTRSLIDISSLGVFALYPIIFIGSVAAFAGKTSFYIIVVQEALYWTGRGIVYLKLDAIPTIANVIAPPETGSFCIYSHSPSWVQWLLIIAIGYYFGAAIIKGTIAVITVSFVIVKNIFWSFPRWIWRTIGPRRKI